MKKLLAFLTYLSALLGIVPFLRPGNRSATALLWPLKLLAGALSPILGLVSGLGAVLGLASRDLKLVGAGALGAGLAARFVRDIPSSQAAFDTAFGPGWQGRVPASLRPRLPRRGSLPARPPGPVGWQRDLVYASSPTTGAPLLADLWEPPPSVPRTGLGLIYVHGGGWRVGDKDLGTRPFFRRLAGQGHIVLDIAYSLWPQGDIPAMVSEVKLALLWMKDNAGQYGVDPERIVLMGGSAGGHLALLAAYTPNHPDLQPTAHDGDTSVRGVVAFYPPTDLLTLRAQAGEQAQEAESLLAKAADAMLSRLFMLHALEAEDGGPKIEFQDFVAAILGGQANEVPETYRLLSPSSHVGAHCPPTLLLQGSDDLFGLAPMVRRLHDDLRKAGVPSILVEFPHTEHAFDLVLPQVSPTAQAATYDVERFLALL